ncbi:MAG: TniQ family protein [Gammaproteobacteria bacterium]|nr:TniQ family protein [Gammaproteobacteria bacterium]MBL4882788.1 TniQ family protein [Oleispira sp.]
MLGFPTPYPNELLYSTIARAGLHSGEVSPKCLLDAVFGNRGVIATVDLPSHIRSIADQYPPSLDLTSKRLINNHSLWPVYAPFIHNKRRAKIEVWMLNSFRSSVHFSSGISSSRIKTKQSLLICPNCVTEQQAIYGEGYWDRRWQIPLVFCCPIHGPLHQTNIQLNGEHRHAYIAISEAKIINQLHVSNTDVRFSEIVQQLFNNTAILSPTFDQWTQFYQGLAIDQGCIKGKRIDHKKIQAQYCKYWSKDWLVQTNLLPSKKDSSWLKTIFRKHRKSFSFAEHLTVIDALFYGEVGVNDAIRKALKYPVKKEVLIKSVSAIDRIIYTDQSKWLAFLEDSSPKNARQQASALYGRLYRNHYNWLMQMNSEHHCHAAQINHRVDWGRRDRDTARTLLNHCNKIEDNLSLPRLSKSHLLHQLSNSATIEKNLYRLPRCYAVLERYSEDKTEYQARRLARAVISFKQRGQVIKEWLLLRETGLSKERMTEVIKKLLKEILKDA